MIAKATIIKNEKEVIILDNSAYSAIAEVISVKCRIELLLWSEIK